ncbi:MAG: hypothetical protein DCF15_22210 [Phormidesmis priestleyi]|uniref:Uncharacterized protein n=1 Tax=Phormidesmis priestleyi TaxID=268141 RepID=A0A2W4WQ80_9CYAN|nr:MAG: hypothetical protein DCF15_22210 [Phormidesmis priestleyi]
MFNPKSTDRFSTLAHCLTSRPLLSAGLLSAILLTRSRPLLSTVNHPPSALLISPCLLLLARSSLIQRHKPSR